MARPQKEGLDYFPLDTGFFDDKSVKILKGKYGIKGVTVYVYLLCAVYKDKGYYTPFDGDLSCVAASDLGMQPEEIEEIVGFLCRAKLFDATLFSKEKVLTSRGIQKRFQTAIKSRLLKRRSPTPVKYWLLSPEETQALISSSMKKPPKEKEIKENKNILNESIQNKCAYARASTTAKGVRKNSFQDYDDTLTDFDIEIIKRRLENFDSRGDNDDK